MASSKKSDYVLEPTYGKQSVPVLKVRRVGAHHDVTDMTVKIMLEGQIGDSWVSGQNHQIVPTETQKNTCYALALKTAFSCIEEYATALATDMLGRHKHLTSVTLDVSEREWKRVDVGGKAHNHVFMTSKDPVKRTCAVKMARDGQLSVTSGVCDVQLMKTTQSGFTGFIQDKYTDLKAVGGKNATVADRIMCTELEANWTFGKMPRRGTVLSTNKEIFQLLLDEWSGPADTGRFSESVQQTAYRMAAAVLAKFPMVDTVFLATPNIHNYTYPLEKFGLQNPNIVFQSTNCHTSASGRIETRLSRKAVTSRL